MTAALQAALEREIAALAALDRGDDVADRLAEHRIRGQRQVCQFCPLAVYFAWRLAAVLPYAHTVNVDAGGIGIYSEEEGVNVAAVTPWPNKALASFVVRLDNGEWPGLIGEPAAGGERL